jgi:hypothetical protein
MSSSYGGGSRRVFGQSMGKKQGRGGSNYQRQFGGGGKSGNSFNANSNNNGTNNPESEAARQAARRRLRQEQGEAIDAKFGYHRLEDVPQQQQQQPHGGGSDIVQRRGWLFHMLPTTVRSTFLAVGLIVLSGRRPW